MALNHLIFFYEHLISIMTCDLEIYFKLIHTDNKTSDFNKNMYL